MLRKKEALSRISDKEEAQVLKGIVIIFPKKVIFGNGEMYN